MNPSIPTREILWNISHVWVMYALLVPTVLIGGYGFYRRWMKWRRGLPTNRFDQPGKRARRLIEHALAQRRTMQQRYAGIFHTLIYTGFAVLTIATIVVMIDYDFGIPLMQGAFYLYFQSFLVDVFGALTMMGILLAAGRRMIGRPKKLVYTDESNWILVAIFFIALTGFLVEGWRIAATDDPWAAWSPFGHLVAMLSSLVIGPEGMRSAHLWVWWIHAIAVFGFLAWAPYTKLAHVVTAPLNIYTASLEPVGASLKDIDFEKAEVLGVNSLAEFTWKDLLDLDACTECGRCSEVCPAHTVGKSLSPRDIILDLRQIMHEEPGELSGRATSGDLQDDNSNEAHEGRTIIDKARATAPEALWACTTCAACVEACPVFIEQMPKILDMRRYLVMEQAEFPETMQEAVTSLESRGHPFRGTQSSRIDWTEGLDIPALSDPAAAQDAEVLLWVGCGGALVERNQKITRALAQLLAKAGVKFAILGREEKCTGDPARRIGNEFLFEMLAKENVEQLRRYQIRKIVTACPHCFNTFLNEYPKLGARFEVYHHTQFLEQLVQEGRLSPTPQSDRVTLHDPCYLGRHNGVFEAPRQLIQAVSNEPIELEQSRERSFCCGGGGGMSFVEEPPEQRVNQERAQQILGTDAEIVAVACPFCTTMLEDGINARKGSREIRVMDVAELMWENVK